LATFVLIHGAGDSSWDWLLVGPELRARGHDVVAMDLPCDDDSAGLEDYADTVVGVIGDHKNLVVVAQSFAASSRRLCASGFRLTSWCWLLPNPGTGRGAQRLLDEYRLAIAQARSFGVQGCECRRGMDDRGVPSRCSSGTRDRSFAEGTGPIRDPWTQALAAGRVAGRTDAVPPWSRMIDGEFSDS
jgi:hypothetical protein